MGTRLSHRPHFPTGQSLAFPAPGPDLTAPVLPLTATRSAALPSACPRSARKHQLCVLSGTLWGLQSSVGSFPCAGVPNTPWALGPVPRALSHLMRSLGVRPPPCSWVTRSDRLGVWPHCWEFGKRMLTASVRSQLGRRWGRVTGQDLNPRLGSPQLPHTGVWWGLLL